MSEMICILKRFFFFKKSLKIPPRISKAVILSEGQTMKLSEEKVQKDKQRSIQLCTDK